MRSAHQYGAYLVGIEGHIDHAIPWFQSCFLQRVLVEVDRSCGLAPLRKRFYGMLLRRGVEGSGLGAGDSAVFDAIVDVGAW